MFGAECQWRQHAGIVHCAISEAWERPLYVQDPIMRLQGGRRHCESVLLYRQELDIPKDVPHAALR